MGRVAHHKRSFLTHNSLLVLLPVEVEGPDRPVQRGGDDDLTALSKGYTRDSRVMFTERDETETTARVPHLHLQPNTRSEVLAFR